MKKELSEEAQKLYTELVQAVFDRDNDLLYVEDMKDRIFKKYSKDTVAEVKEKVSE